MKKFKRIYFCKLFSVLSQTIVSEPTLNEVIASQNLSEETFSTNMSQSTNYQGH
jgi:hypothetical protein